MINCYRGLVMLVLGLYAVVVFTGWEMSGPERKEIPASVRNSPGGYRSYHFWYSGTHGGK